MGKQFKYRQRLALYLLASSLVATSADFAALADPPAEPVAAPPSAAPAPAASPAVSSPASTDGAAAAPAAASSATPAPAIPKLPTGPSAEGLELPDLAFTETPEIVEGYEKFFYFHRPNTSFVEAYNDIRECEGLANGSNIYMGNVDTTTAAMTGGLPGLAGGLIGGLLVDAIWGAAQRRKEKRIKIRNCMGFKEYQRYGLPKGLWQKLNSKPKKGDPKQTPDYSLRLRAALASGPVPAQKVLPK